MLHHQISNSRENYNYNAVVYDNVYWQTHFHKNYELIYVCDGFLDLNVGTQNIQLSKGELFFINPFVIHSFRVEKGSKVWVGVFSHEFISLFAKKNKAVTFSKFRCDSEIEEFLADNFFLQGNNDTYTITACLNLVCSQCEKNASKINVATDTHLMKLILDYISDNYHTNISLKEIAVTLGYEYHYLSNVFNSLFNMNFKAFVNLYRFQHACELLTDTDLDLTTIGYDCGFQSPRNFNRIFKELSGETPSDYRKKIK